MSAKYCLQCGAPLVWKTIPNGPAPAQPASEQKGPRRLACSRCSFVFYNNPVPVVAAIVEHNNDVILVRSIGWPENWFGLVTGFIEQGEDPRTACLREVKEELGVDGELVRLVGSYGFKRMNQIIIAYHVRLPAGDLTITIDRSELADFKRVPIDKLRPWPTGTGDAVKDWLAGRKVNNSSKL